MAETPKDASKENSAGKLDLSGLTDLSLGPNWGEGNTPSTSTPRRSRERSGGGAAPRRARPQKRDRSERGGAPERGGRSGAPRRDARRHAPEPTPPFEPVVEVSFYPEDAPFRALAQAIRTSARTFELFELARLILEKEDRYVCVIRPRSGKEGGPDKLTISIPDGLPFLTEQEALNHVFKKHMTDFFAVEEVEVDPPTGNFQIIHRCGITGELLGPPNYHRYQAILQEHHQTRLAHIPYERFQQRIETVRDEDAVAQWLEKMKHQPRFTLKDKPTATPAASSPADEASAEDSAEAEATDDLGETEKPEASDAVEETEAEAADTPEAAESTEGDAAAQEAPAEKKSDAIVFTDAESARIFLLTRHKDKLVRPANNARFSGKLLAEMMPNSPIRRSVEAVHEQQMRFPLDTANHLRGRLRRLNFAVYKKGSKGVSYVCVVKRRFRAPGEELAENLNDLITFIEAHPNMPAKDLPREYLGITPEEKPESAPSAESPEAASETEKPAEAEAAASAPSAEELSQLKDLKRDLRYLVTQGYVIEYSDGRLFAPAPLDQSGSKKSSPQKEKEKTGPKGAPAKAEAPEAAPSAEAPEAKAASESEKAPEAPQAEQAPEEPQAAVTTEEPAEEASPSAPEAEKPAATAEGEDAAVAEKGESEAAPEERKKPVESSAAETEILTDAAEATEKPVSDDVVPEEK